MVNVEKNGFRFLSYPLAALLAVFIASRFLLILGYPMFSDEAIYVQYTRAINHDWSANKFISVSFNFYDWKPPLMYWIASVFYRPGADPLLCVRYVAASISIIGFLSVYALAGYYFKSGRAAFWAGLLWILNPMVVFYDREFIAETFVYSFSAATLLFAYLSVDRSRFFAVPAVIFGVCSILSKQSGQLTLYAVLFLAATQITVDDSGGKKRIAVNYINIALVFATVILSLAAYRLVIPARYFANYESFTRNWTFTITELLHFPVRAWTANLITVWGLYANYYTLLVPPVVAFFIYLCVKRRDRRDLLLLAWFAFSSCAIIFGLKQFNEYIYNTSNVIFLTMMMAAVFSYLQATGKKTPQGASLALIRYGLPAVISILWAYQLSVYYAEPKGYIERYGTGWMKENYLYGWPNGFGTDEMVSILKKERDKTVFIDPQRGPSNSVLSYGDLYPTLRIEEIPKDVAMLDALAPNSAVVIFKGLHRGWDDKLLTQQICRDRFVYTTGARSVPLVICRN